MRKLLEPYLAVKLIEGLPDNQKWEDLTLDIRKKAIRILDQHLDNVDINAYLDIDLKLNELLMQPAQDTVLGEIHSFISGRSLRVRSYAESIVAGN